MKICKSKKATGWLRGSLFVAAVVLMSGCEMTSSAPAAGQEDVVSRIRISALTDMKATDGAESPARINAFVELLDADEMPRQAACSLRFELYEYQPHSANPRGKRLLIWPDVRLPDVASGEQHWKQSLQAYEFFLPMGFMPSPDQQYVLEATCLIGPKRLTDLRKLQFQP